MTKEEIKAYVRQRIYENSNREITALSLNEALDKIIDALEDNRIGDIGDLETDHKSNLVEAINELVGVIDNDTMVLSMSMSSAEIRKVYYECLIHTEIAKNIVFLNADGMHYRVNGYKMQNNVLYLNTIMADGNTLRSVNMQIGSNGTISII